MLLITDAFVPIISLANHQIKHHQRRTQPLNEQIAHVATINTDDFMLNTDSQKTGTDFHKSLIKECTLCCEQTCVKLQAWSVLSCKYSCHNAPNEAFRGIKFHTPITGSWQTGSPPTPELSHCKRAPAHVDAWTQPDRNERTAERESIHSGMRN